MTRVKVDVQKLVQLAQVAVSSNELKGLEKELPSILDFASQVQEAGGEVKKETGAHYNVYREDGEPHKGELYSGELIEAMPKSQDRYLKVKKIINN